MSYCNSLLGTFSGSSIRQTLSVPASDKPIESQSDALMDTVMLKLLSVPELDSPMESYSDALISILM
jgi:hypothetical protein